MAKVANITLFGHTYTADTLTKVYEATPAPNKSEPATQVKIGSETYNYNGLTVTWPAH